MTYQATNVMTGLVNKPVSPSMAVTNAVNKATSTPTDAARLGNVTQMNVKPTVNNAPAQDLNVSLGAFSQSLQSTQNTTPTSTPTQQPAPTQQPSPDPNTTPQNIQEEPSQREKALQEFYDKSTELESKGARTLEIQEEEGVFEKKARAKNLENEYTAKERAFDKQIEEAKKNNEGKLRGGVLIDIQGLESRKYSQLADIAFAYKIANDDYTGAWEMAQSKVEAEFAPLVARLDTLKNYYELSSKEMTDKEKMEAEANQKKLEAEIKFGMDKELKAYEQTIRQSDPLYQAQLRAQELENKKLRQETEFTYDGDTVSVPSFESYKQSQSSLPQYDAWRTMLGLPNTTDIQKRYNDAVKKEEVTLKQKYQDEKELLTRASAIQKISPFARELLQNPKGFFNITPSAREDVLKELANAGIDTASLQSGRKQKLSATQADDLVQAQIAYQGVQNLKSMLDELDQTGPVIGRLREMNPYDPQVVAIMAEINRIVPGLARGVFKEVGVLTDTDINRYTATLANPRATREQVMALHEDTMNKIEQSLMIIEDTYTQLGYDLGTFEFKPVSNEVSQEAKDILTKYGIEQ